MATATIDAQVKKYLDAQEKHSKDNEGRTTAEGGKDYQSSEAERAAGDIRLAHYETMIADASSEGDQELITVLTREYQEKRLALAIKKLGEGEE